MMKNRGTLAIITLTYLVMACGVASCSPRPDDRPAAATGEQAETQRPLHAATPTPPAIILAPTADCAQTQTPTALVTPTLPNLPAGAVVWEPYDILIEYEKAYGDGFGYLLPKPPLFLLFSDGLLVIEDVGNIFIAHLKREEICQILNSFDQFGFQDASMDGVFLMEGAPGTSIWVSGWNHNNILVYNLDQIIFCSTNNDTDKCSYMPSIDLDQGIIDAYRFLESFDYLGLELYSPEKYLLNVYRYGELDDENLTDWPFSDHPLEMFTSLIPENGIRQVVTIVDDWAKEFDLGFIEVNGEIFFVEVRPLWPRETLISRDLRIGTPEEARVDVLWCSPQDGVWE